MIKRILIILLLSSCARTPISKKECELGQWDLIGQRDGRAGRSEGAILKYMEVCRDHNSPVDKNEYLKGRNEGLKEYCSVQGKRNGIQGITSVVSVCSKLASIYSAANQEGLKNYCTTSRARELGVSGEIYKFENCPSAKRKELEKFYSGGATVYCDPANGYRFGRDGGNPRTEVCSKDFLSALDDGRKVNELVATHADIKEEVEHLREKLIAKETPVAKRLKISYELGERERELEGISQQISSLEAKYE